MASSASPVPVANSFASPPRVVAAGHKGIPAPKSGNSYPAFLISLPVVTPSSSTYPDSARLPGNTCRWRTKRDLLLLSRAAAKGTAAASAKCSNNGGGRNARGEFPKSTYSKLADAAASCPWIRPDSEGAPAACSDAENGWRPEMYKSARRLDSFLVECRELYERAASGELDKPGSTCGDALPIVKGWEVFCRPADSGGLIDFLAGPCDPKDVRPGESSNERFLPADPTKRAASLGQYFASDQNAIDVSDAALELTKFNVRNVVFVEPSCGDGRILARLVETCSIMGFAPYCVLGYDIDETTVGPCSERIISIEPKEKGGGGKSVLPKVPVAVRQADFLALTKEELLRDVYDARKQWKECNCDADDVSTDALCFVFFGGPPYSLGPLSKEDDNGNLDQKKRGVDLPHHFILKGLIDLQGDAASFLLPERYGKDVDIRQKELNGLDTKGRRWKCATDKATNSSFDFRGKAVVQPSVLQSWFYTTGYFN